jgi:hypothetical protein
MANPNCPIPSNINPLSPTGFRLSVSKLPDLVYFCQEVNLPEVELPSMPMATTFSTIGVPGDMLRFGDLTVQFIVDENLANYKGVFDWLIGLGFPENYVQYQTFSAQDPAAGGNQFGGMIGDYSDAILEILGSQNTPTQTILFRDVHPVSISSLPFTSNATDVNYLIGTATFRYNYYEFMDITATSSAVGAAN